MSERYSKRIERLKKITKSKGLFEIYSIASRREREGKRVVHMEIGRPDFDTPASIKEAAINSLSRGDIYYTDLAGVYELRKAITQSLERQAGILYDENKEIAVTSGASEALYAIWTAFLDEEDEVLVPSPCYSSYVHSITYAGGKIKEVPILENGKVVFDLDLLEKSISNRTKILLVNSPNNPLGNVLSLEQLQALAYIAIRHNLIVVSDECYDRFIFEGKHYSIASLEGMRERTLIVNSSSKTYAMTGWRIGYVAGPAEYVDRVAKIHSHITVCATSFAQYAAAVAYEADPPEIQGMIEEFQRRKDYIEEQFSLMNRFNFIKPEGAFYVFFDVSKTGLDSVEFCEQILSERGIALAPGSSFGTGWDTWVRLSYACSMEDIRFAVKQIIDFFDEKSEEKNEK